MTKTRRWLKSAIAASVEPQIAMPWQRGARRRPAAMRPAATVQTTPPKSGAIAAH